MKFIIPIIFSFMLFPFWLYAEERDPNLYNFSDSRNQLVFTCKKPTCRYDDDHHSDIKGIPLLKSWAIEEPIYYETAGGVRANVPTITYVDTKSGLWIIQNPRQMMHDPNFVRCIEFSYSVNKDYFEEELCLVQAKVSQKSRKQGETLLQLIKRWRLSFQQSLIKKAKAEKQTLLKQGLKKHNGNYFSVLYPASFSINSGRNNNSQSGDEASFTAAGKTVEFFVYSPLWSGKPKNYLETSSNETLISSESKKSFKKGEYLNYISTQWATFKAKDGSYLRSYIAQRACHDDGQSNYNDCVSKVFGIKYKNHEVYKQYKSAYLKFKQSLEQYAD